MKNDYISFDIHRYLRIAVTIILFNPFSVSAQQGTAFPNIEGTWEVSHYWMDLPPDSPWSYEFEIFEAFHIPETDTLMSLLEDGDIVGKYYSTTDQVYFCFVTNFRPYSFDFEVDNDVYFLLYDFSLEIGDTAYTDVVSGVGTIEQIIVDNITMENQSGNMIKHFHLSNGDDIVEKIGSLEGLFRPFLRTFEIGHTLCNQVGAFDYPTSWTNYGYTATVCVPWNPNIGLETNELNELTAYPNPANDLLHVTTEFPIANYTIYSTAGGTVEMPANLLGNKLELNVSELPPGLYFLELKGRGGNFQRLHFLKN